MSGRTIGSIGPGKNYRSDATTSSSRSVRDDAFLHRSDSLGEVILEILQGELPIPLVLNIGLGRPQNLAPASSHRPGGECGFGKTLGNKSANDAGETPQSQPIPFPPTVLYGASPLHSTSFAIQPMKRSHQKARPLCPSARRVGLLAVRTFWSSMRNADVLNFPQRLCIRLSERRSEARNPGEKETCLLVRPQKEGCEGCTGEHCREG